MGDGRMFRMRAASERQRVAAYGVARRDGEVLLTRASPGSGVPGTWWLPGGGVKFGESPRECLGREFMEETGLTVRVLGVMDVVADVTSMMREPVRLHSIRVVYEVEVSPGAAVPEVAGSTDAVQWVACRRLSELPLIPWLQNFASAHLAPP